MSDEWEGEPHALTVRSVRVPADWLDDGEIDCDIAHPESCKQEQRDQGDGVTVPVWTCELAWHLNDGFPLLQALIYSGTPVTGPGTYRIRSWGRKYYVWDAAAYEYDGGIALIGDDDA